MRRRSSDVHIEPWDSGTIVRFRIDGVLHDVVEFPLTHHARVTTRIKVLARIVVYQRDVPQDGRIDPEAMPCGKAIRWAWWPFPTAYTASYRRGRA